MFDFKLTKKGDLDLDYGSYGTPQKVSFVVGDYEAQRIKFMVTPLVAPNKKPAQQRILFKLADVPETDFTSKNMQDDEINSSAKEANEKSSEVTSDEDVMSNIDYAFNKYEASKNKLDDVIDEIDALLNKLDSQSHTSSNDEYDE